MLSSLLCAAVLVSGAAALSPSHPPDPGQVVASIDNQPVYVSEVLPHLQPLPPRVGAGPAPDMRRQALEQALRNRLLAGEALRRGLAAEAARSGIEVARALRIRALIDAELARHDERLAGALSSEALHAFYREHSERLRSLESAKLASLVVSDAELAERLLQEAAEADDATFRGLVAGHSEDLLTKDRDGELGTIDKHADGLEAPLARVAIGLKHDGAVGLAVDVLGRYHVLRAREVKLEEKPWTDAVESQVRNLARHAEREAILESLVAELRQAAVIEVDVAVLERIRVPTWDEALNP